MSKARRVTSPVVAWGPGPTAARRVVAVAWCRRSRSRPARAQYRSVCRRPEALGVGIRGGLRGQGFIRAALQNRLMVVEHRPVDGQGDTGVADQSDLDGRSGLQRDKARQPNPGPALRGRLGGEQRPQQRSGARCDQRRIGEGRHVVTPGELDRRAGGAVQADGGRAAEYAEPAPGAEVQAEAGQRGEEERGQPDHPERLERHGEVRVTRILFTDPPSSSELHPLDRAAPRFDEIRLGCHLLGERLCLRSRQGEEVPVGHRHNRRPVGNVVGLGQVRRGPQHHNA